MEREYGNCSLQYSPKAKSEMGTRFLESKECYGESYMEGKKERKCNLVGAAYPGEQNKEGLQITILPF